MRPEPLHARMHARWPLVVVSQPRLVRSGFHAATPPRVPCGDDRMRSYPYVGRWGHPGGESSQSSCRPYGVVSRRL